MPEFKYTSHADRGDPVFGFENGRHTIRTDANDRGRWLAQYDIALEPGQRYALHGEAKSDAAAEIVIVFFKVGTGYDLLQAETLARIADSDCLQPYYAEFTAPAGARAPRVDLRNWAGAGYSEFAALTLEPAETVPVYPIPATGAPNTVPVSGYKSGSILYAVIHGDQPLGYPPEDCQPMEITGYQAGRDLHLTIHHTDPDCDAPADQEGDHAS